MNSRIVQFPVLPQDQVVQENLVEIIWFDEIKPPTRLLSRLQEIPGAFLADPVFSDTDVLKTLRVSTNLLLLVTTVSNSTFKKNIELLREVNRLNSAETCPRIGVICLTSDAHSGGQVEEYQRHGAQVLARHYPANVVADVANHIVWRLKNGNSQLVVFELVPGSETDRFFLRGPLGSADMALGGVELTLMEFTSNTEQSLTLRQIADSIGRSKASVTEYIRRLRRRYDKIRHSVGVTTPGKNVFVMKKPVTTWVFKLQARIEKK